jgi:hypothetical protein
VQDLMTLAIEPTETSSAKRFAPLCWRGQWVGERGRDEEGFYGTVGSQAKDSQNHTREN